MSPIQRFSISVVGRDHIRVRWNSTKLRRKTFENSKQSETMSTSTRRHWIRRRAKRWIQTKYNIIPFLPRSHSQIGYPSKAIYSCILFCQTLHPATSSSSARLASRAKNVKTIPNNWKMSRSLYLFSGDVLFVCVSLYARGDSSVNVNERGRFVALESIPTIIAINDSMQKCIGWIELQSKLFRKDYY